MRLWSIDFSYLDSKGFGGLWNESIIAKNALTNISKGYKNHPQLNRFKKLDNPIGAINYYLWTIYEHSKERKYHYNPQYIDFDMLSDKPMIPVTIKQIEYERNHLLKKLWIRDKEKYHKLYSDTQTKCHEIFEIIEGEIEEWEKI